MNSKNTQNINKNILNDSTLTDEQKKQEIEKKSKHDLYFMVFLISLTLFGTFIYSNTKETQYGGSYSVFNFLLE